MAISDAYGNRGELLGAQGMDRIDDTSTHTPDASAHGVWVAVKAVTDATFAGGTTVAFGDSPAGDTLAAGDVLLLPFTAIQLASGTVYAIRG